MQLIAEIGINHGGRFNLAKEMIHASILAGADLVKFQHYRPKELLGDSPFLAEAERAQFTKEQLVQLKDYSEQSGIDWACSIFHPEDVEWAESINMPVYKIASRAALNKDLLKSIDNTRKPCILSTGQIEKDQVYSAIESLHNCKLTLLYCVSKYPSLPEDINLEELTELKKYGLPVGLSSHCPDITPAMKALDLGASVIEQHVKFPWMTEGCDMASSIPFKKFGEIAEYARLKCLA